MYLASAFSPSGSHIAAFSTDWLSTLSIHRIRDHEPLSCTSHCVHIPLSGDVSNITWSRAGDRIACATKGGFAVYALDGTQLWVTQTVVKYLSFSPDGRVLATAHEDSGIQLWTLEGNELKAPCPLPGSHPQGDVVYSMIAFSEDSARVISGDFGAVNVWDARAGSNPTSSTPAEDMREDVAKPVAFSPDGEWLATRSEDVFHIWDTSTGHQIYRGESEGSVVVKLLWIHGDSMKKLVVCRKDLVVV